MSHDLATKNEDTITTQPASASTEVHYVQYTTLKEKQYLPAIRALISKDLSEPYSIYVYRYFLYQWGDLCFMAMDENDQLIGVVVSKLERHRNGPLRGYIAMLAVQSSHRGRGIAKTLVRMAIDSMIERDADEIALEAEVTNTAAMRLYESFGFLRSMIPTEWGDYGGYGDERPGLEVEPENGTEMFGQHFI
ncbi:MAG: hypothetical protein Q9227_005715 [Pyrenula ochraceoflavens]